MVTRQAAVASGSSPTTQQSDEREDGNPATPLRAVKGTNGFLFPAIWSFPPFFTLQPNPATLTHQVELWSKLLLDWARFSRVFYVNCEAGGGDQGEVFDNKAIRRRLLPAGIRTVVAALVKDGRAVAEPPKQSDNYLILWKKPDQWGTEIYDWIIENGMNGTILTLWELTDGELTESTDFHALPVPLLRKAIDTLVKKGRAQVIKGEGEAGEGVRFF